MACDVRRARTSAQALIDQFNQGQPDYKVKLVFKGGYSETVMSAIFAVRTRAHPAIVQVNEIGTATMMAAGGAIYPVYQLMKDKASRSTRRPICRP